ncbi:hypothetical protein FSP39_002681 [Pinctada imbricata]|uniref:Uncharacterized protein n=1 Tax=Pinctada imbricata TaxID=66713 RepID=A0AA88YAZ3_PINIB|nr:hypothetical protein FSP39_002681 [Pinctada imbricata]
MSEKDEKENDPHEKPLDVEDSDVSVHSDDAKEDKEIGPEDEGTAATIDHETVHIDLTRKTKEVDNQGENGDVNQTVISTQPTVVYGYDQHITIDGVETPVVKQGPNKPKPKDFVVTSCFVVLCCNFIFGLIGYHYGVKANHAWQLGDEPAARSRSKMALIMVICGIVAGLTTYALAFGIYFSTRDSDDPYLTVNHNIAG